MKLPTEWILLARILRPQGRRGEVLADLFTDFPERFAEHPQVWLAAADFTDAATPAASAVPPQAASVAAHWLPVGKNAGRVVLHFSGVETIEQAELLAGKEVIAPRAERVELEPGAAYISDLTGCTVYDRGNSVGIVEDVQFATTPDGMRRLEDAAPLLTVASPAGDEILIPYATAYLQRLDLAARAIYMELPAGLAEINLPNQPSTPQDDASESPRD
jgi:16S rRNA processing protein RimM